MKEKKDYSNSILELQIFKTGAQVTLNEHLIGSVLLNPCKSQQINL